MATPSATKSLWIVSARLQQLPIHGQRLLQVAACLGSFFERAMLKVALEATGFPGSEERDTPSSQSCSPLDFLDEALDQNLIVDARKFGMFRFSHGKIHEAALNLTDSAGAEDLRWKIGKALWKEALWNQWQTRSSPVGIGAAGAVRQFENADEEGV